MAYYFRDVKVLVVDDMMPMLSLTASLLKIFGFDQIIQATSAEEAFQKYVEFNPDIVITDWLLGEEDGTDLIFKIRNESLSPNKFVPIIMMSGYSHKMRVEHARDCGVTEFLVKPFKAKDLYKRIEQLIEKPRQFVDADDFFGPDRRRRKEGDYRGPFRREEETPETEAGFMDAAERLELVRELEQQAKDAAGLLKED